MPSITVMHTGKQILCQKGESLMDALLDAGVFLEHACNGAGVCGKCKVKTYRGDFSRMTTTEREMLSREEIEKGIRLACMTKVEGDGEIDVLQKERPYRILTKEYVPPFQRDAVSEGWGIAADIGTTTVAAALTDLQTGEVLETASMVNGQRRYGLDVLTRITYENEQGQQGISQLQQAAVRTLSQLTEEMCSRRNIPLSALREIVVAANCTMTHMLLGVDARPIGKAPYRPAFLEGRTCPTGEVGLPGSEKTTLYCLPQVSGYVGGDIVAGAYVCGLHKASGNVLFIDIGTNGELVLSAQGRLLCCSCAAGPALEGMNITSGMAAAEGAVEEVSITENGISLKVIGEQAPVGLCGSGILSAVKEMLRTGMLRKNGAFSKENGQEAFWKDMLQTNGGKKALLLSQDPQILVTQKDVRQVQLAKGAIRSGMDALLAKAQLTVEDLDQVMIAGQFGQYLPEESLLGVGVLPQEVRGRLTYVGNSSKTGAYMALLSQKARAEMEELALRMEYMELAESENYERLFARSTIFPENRSVK
ncbi:MAG: ASKHA domain-containing protein [Eubacteriales bacterium]|nr:ASKHA domain-containing protein [Eubacteriales bacterium]